MQFYRRSFLSLFSMISFMFSYLYYCTPERMWFCANRSEIDPEINYDRILTDYFISFQFILRHINHEISDFLDTEVDIKSTRYQINLETQKMQSNLYSVRSHLLFYIYIILYWYTFKNSQKLIFINEIHNFFV